MARVIKKYANRRLYDTSTSEHLTLDQVRKLVADGETIQVVDAKTGDDLTRLVLLQIISEQEAGGQPLLTTGLLEQLIRFYGSAFQGFMGSYLEKSVSTFILQQETLQKQMSDWMSDTPLSNMADMARQNLEAWKSMQDSLMGRGRDDKDD